MADSQGKVKSLRLPWIAGQSIGIPQAIITATIMAGLAAPAAISAVFLQALSDAYLAVTVYVAITIIPIQWLGKRLEGAPVERVLKSRLLRIPLAAALGAAPGCGGAIVVTAAFAKGKLCFASVVAVLTATMGDAAFLLMAKSPSTLALMMGVGFCVGTITGWAISVFHREDFLRPPPTLAIIELPGPTENPEPMAPERFLGLGIWWSMLILGGALLWLPVSAFEYVGLVHEDLILPIGGLGAILCVLNWLLTPIEQAECPCESKQPVQSAINTTNRVTIWVIVAFLVYELGAMASPISLQDTITEGSSWLPLLGAFIGLFPSCGPQVLFTEFYLRGIIDLPGLVANGISNDGDALFPMLAIAPKAAFLSFFYTLVPALAAGYGIYWFMG
ncbi:MAG: putative manganese transporter [Myxococcota bacterium]|nr:putative manganese transporter [Myxococcota bacterium]